MHKLGDQWVENLDDLKDHMLKAVYGKFCHGCLFKSIIGRCTHNGCMMENSESMIVKDLGILKDGRIPCPVCGRYPVVYENFSNPSQKTKVSYYHVVCSWKEGRVVHHEVSVYGRTIDESNKRWNRRA
jgi:hypothetical protein